jgi:hypothetical protein
MSTSDATGTPPIHPTRGCGDCCARDGAPERIEEPGRTEAACLVDVNDARTAPSRFVEPCFDRGRSGRIPRARSDWILDRPELGHAAGKVEIAFHAFDRHMREPLRSTAAVERGLELRAPLPVRQQVRQHADHCDRDPVALGEDERTQREGARNDDHRA